MKKGLITILLVAITAGLLAYGGKIEKASDSVTLEGETEWVAVDTLDSPRFASMAWFIITDPSDSIVAYRVKGEINRTSGKYYYIEDSARVTGSDGHLFEWDPNNFDRMILELFEISDSVDVYIDRIQKNPSE